MATMRTVSPLPGPRDLFGEAWKRNAPLAALVVGMLALIAAALVGLAIDPRVITGAPAWMKPLKFAISIAVYGATMLWMLSFIPDRPRLAAALSWGLSLGFAVEMVLIVIQVVRGTTSHFNKATPFDAAVWNAMGATITVMWLFNLVVAVLLLRRRFAPAPILWGVRLGLAAALVGMAVAFLMAQPTADQAALMDAGGSSPISGAHAVGVEDGGPGLPVVGWSTTGGDLRVGHFLGLHALQGLPLIGFALARLGPAWLSMRDRSRLVGIASLAWIGVTAIVTWQALRGQSVIAPDGLTLTALGGLLGLALIAAGAVATRSRAAASAARGRGALATAHGGD
jgi:hypothetical protein